ncbi:U-box domain-containing protein [Parashewanella curva]|uniref:U-box domain-containing protein n=1 Tax=Parashewanella curva TaxID=2338552 RepID=UPI000EF7A64B|nr:U-box domain-containing protein [Parashewanella curva]
MSASSISASNAPEPDFQKEQQKVEQGSHSTSISHSMTITQTESALGHWLKTSEEMSPKEKRNRSLLFAPLGVTAPPMHVIESETLTATEAEALLKESGCAIHNPMVMGVLLGVDAESLFEVEPSIYSTGQQCLMKVFSQVEQLSLAVIFQAIHKTFAPNHEGFDVQVHGISHIISCWAYEHQIPLGTVVEGEARRHLESFLCGFSCLQTEWHTFGLNLNLKDYDIEIIKRDVLFKKDCKKALREMLVNDKTLTLDKLKKALVPIDGKSMVCIKELEQWASQQCLDASANLYGSDKLEVVIRICYRVAAEYDILSVYLINRLVLSTNRLQERCTKVLLAAEKRGVLTKGNMLDTVSRLCGDSSAKALAKRLALPAPYLSEETSGELLLTLCRNHKLKQKLSLYDCYRLLSTVNSQEVLKLLFHGQDSNPYDGDFDEKLAIQLVQALKNDSLKPKHIMALANSGASNLPLPDTSRFPDFEVRGDRGSRLVEACDVLPLLNVPHLAYFCLLMIGEAPIRSDVYLGKDDITKRIACWQLILSRLPFLQTGHLKNLMLGEFKTSHTWLPQGGYIDEPSLTLSSLCAGFDVRSKFIAECQKYLPVAKQFYDELNIRSYIQKQESLTPFLSALPKEYQVLFAVNQNSALFKQFEIKLEEYLTVISNLGLQEKSRKPSVQNITKIGVSYVDEEAEKNAPFELRCPITQCLLVDPIVIFSSKAQVPIYFSKAALIRWLTKKQVNPVSLEPLKLDDAVKLAVDQKMVEKIKKYKKQTKERLEREMSTTNV